MARDDLLSTIRSEIETRLAALRPLLAEHEQLLAAAQALEAHEPSGSDRAAPSAEPSSGGPARSARRGRSAAGGTQPAITPPTGAGGRASGSRTASKGARSSQGAKRSRAQRGAAREAILAALEHGSHTVSELVVVTAMSGPNINGNLRRLLSEGAIAKTERRGKLAYMLATVA
jgi:DNA-binding transcriptional ArsR family regulator